MRRQYLLFQILPQTQPVDPTPQIIGALIGGFFGILGTVLAFRLNQKRKVIIYEVVSIPLLRFTPGEKSPLQVLVRKSLLTPGAPENETEPVTSAYGFEIRCTNDGNQSITAPVIAIALNKSARILQADVSPNNPIGYKVRIDHDEKEPYKINISVPYLNSTDTFTIHLLSTGNTNRQCDVNILAQEIVVKELNVEPLIWRNIGLLALVPVIILVTGIAVFNSSLRLALGGTPTKVGISGVDGPLWLDALVILGILVMLGILAFSNRSSRKLRRWRGYVAQWDIQSDE
jgi:hypothetical protein